MGKGDALPVAPLTAYGFEVGCSCFSPVQHEMATNVVFAFASTLQRGTFTLRTPLTSCLLGPSAFRNFATKKMPNPQVFFDIAINNQNAGRIVMEVTSWHLALYSFSVSCVSLGFFLLKIAGRLRPPLRLSLVQGHVAGRHFSWRGPWSTNMADSPTRGTCHKFQRLLNWRVNISLWPPF